MLQQVQKTPSTSVRSLTHLVRVSHFNFWRILPQHDMHLFRVQHVQALQLDDYAPRLAFSQWYFRKCATDPLFPAKVLFSDEASFTREEIFKTHNAHICAWAEANPLEYNVVQHRLIFGQCLGRYYRDYLIGRYLFLFV